MRRGKRAPHGAAAAVLGGCWWVGLDYSGSRRRRGSRAGGTAGDSVARTARTSAHTTTSRPQRSEVRPLARSHARALVSATGSSSAALETGNTAPGPRARRSAWRSLGIGRCLRWPEPAPGEVGHECCPDDCGAGLSAVKGGGVDGGEKGWRNTHSEDRSALVGSRSVHCAPRGIRGATVVGSRVGVRRVTSVYVRRYGKEQRRLPPREGGR